VRAFMEPRFGADFSSVRVHTGGEAVQMNQDLGAQAFTHGSDVYFGAGKDPGNNELTAHELTHVVQQTGAQNSLISRSISSNFHVPFILRKVTVGLYEGASGFGHIGVGVNSPTTTGLYPSPKAPAWKLPLGMSVPGIVKTDEAKSIGKKDIKTTEKQDQQIQGAIDQAIGKPPKYNLFSHNCAHHGADMLESGGIGVTRSRFPQEFFEKLPK